MFHRTTQLLAVAGLVALLSAGSTLADNEKGTAVIKGKVTFDGTPSPTQQLPAMTGDAYCAQQNPKPLPDQSTIVYTKEGNAIPYVFVYAKEGPVTKNKYDVPSEPVVIDQKGCVYHPHVFGMIAGQQMNIKSSDATNHNIHSLPKKNTEFNIGQPQPGVIERKGKDTFNKPETAIKFKCDVHSWMTAWCFVMTHPFFSVTKDHNEAKSATERGTFEIKDLPAGEYTLEAWHEKFGAVTQKVTVKDGETKEIEFKMGPKKTGAADFADDGKLATVVSHGGSCCATNGSQAK